MSVHKHIQLNLRPDFLGCIKATLMMFIIGKRYYPDTMTRFGISLLK